jgi:hypothetical protein
MLPRTVVAVAIVALLSWPCFAASSIGSISSAQPIVVSGITVSTNRVMSWPVAVNDEIVTHTAPATLRFTDGSVVTLQRNSRMKLEPLPSGVGVKMLSGSAIYDLKPSSTVSLGTKYSGTDIPGNAALAATARPVSQNEATATALAYRMPASAPSSGIVFAPSMFGTAAFAPAISRQANPAGAKNMITLPNGLVVFVNPVTSGGVVTGYTIVGVGADTQTGGVLPTPSVTGLDGYTISVSNGPTGNSQVKIFAPGSSTPLSDSQAATLIQNTTTTVNQNLPPGQQISTTPGITIQPFSVSGN